MSLTETQKQEIDKMLANSKQPDLLNILRVVFRDNSLKLTNKEGRLLKEYIASKAIDLNVNYSKKKSEIILTPEQKSIIEKNWEDLENSTLFNLVFNGLEYNEFCEEWIAIKKYINGTLYDKVAGSSNINYEKREYTPPKNLHEVCFKIREYLKNDWKVENLKKEQKDCVESLKRYLNDVRFCTRMSNYLIEDDRRIFESTFVKYCYDKPDLTQEELDQFITLSIEVAIGEDILKRMDRLKKNLDQLAEDKDGKISMGLNEAIKNFQDDYNQCLIRQKNLYKTLTGERKSRIDQLIQANASVLHLVRAMKNKEQRDRMVLLGENRKEKLKEEIDKFMSMDELKGLIAGIDENIGLNG